MQAKLTTGPIVLNRDLTGIEDKTSNNESKIEPAILDITFVQQENSDQVIISGNLQLIKNLTATLNRGRFTDIFFYQILTNSPLRDHSTVILNLSELMLNIDGDSVALTIVQYIRGIPEAKQPSFSSREIRLLRYYAFESHTISAYPALEAMSTRDKAEKVKLTPLKIITAIFDKLDSARSIVPTTSDKIFNFLRDSGKSLISSMPTDADIDRHLLPKSYHEIRKSARLVAQLYRNKATLFSKLPEKIAIKIASFTGNPEQHNEIMATKIATRHFRRPAITRK